MALISTAMAKINAIYIIPIVIFVALIGVLVWWLRKNTKMGILRNFGFEYDYDTDLFYGRMNSWQRKYGYCRLYDAAAPMINIITDSEPIEFGYDHRKWLIELWKGQYGMALGCEIGVYTSNLPEIKLPGIFLGNYYNLTKKDDFLDVAYILKKNGREVMSRSGKHWWLTGFKFGEFANPSELVMIAKIRFQTVEMCRSFVSALRKLGYTSDNYLVHRQTVIIKFTEPFSTQVDTKKDNFKAAQNFNKANCEIYQQINGIFSNSMDKIKYIKKYEKKLYRNILNSGKSRSLFANSKFIKKGIKFPFRKSE